MDSSWNLCIKGLIGEFEDKSHPPREDWRMRLSWWPRKEIGWSRFSCGRIRLRGSYLLAQNTWHSESRLLMAIPMLLLWSLSSGLMCYFKSSRLISLLPTGLRKSKHYKSGSKIIWFPTMTHTTVWFLSLRRVWICHTMKKERSKYQTNHVLFNTYF